MVDTDTLGAPWRERPAHRAWLETQAEALFAFFERRAVNPDGGFFELDPEGLPLDADNPVRGLHATCRMVHCYAIAALMGRPGAMAIVDHGMEYLWTRHRDARHGGYHWSLDRSGPRDTSKQGYGHAFVLLAGASAKVAGHRDADRLIADVSEVLESRFWEARHGAITEEFSADWTPVPGYRGQNSNMHLTEALMAAYEATGEAAYLAKAEAISDLIIRRVAGANGFRVAEHFFEDWTVDKAYSGNEMFRPSGTTPGHWLEWSRLVVQLWVLGGRRHAWMPDAAVDLFRQAFALGWDKDRGGFYYTLDWADRPANRAKLWWPVAEAIGAAHFLGHHRPGPDVEAAYRSLWHLVNGHFLDRHHGGWYEELTEDLAPAHTLFRGKGDIYHALQACLIPLFPADGSLTAMIGARHTPA